MACCCSGGRLFHFEVLADLLLAPRRQVLELLVIAHEALLLLGRHVPHALDPFWRQAHHAALARSLVGGRALLLH